jgi:DNA-binding response OmpR family regulator
MTLSSMVVSCDWPEVSVLECILGGLHIGVDVESEPERARAKLAKSKIDAVIVDCDLNGASGFLRNLQGNGVNPSSVPLVIVSGSSGRQTLEATGASFIFEKPISVEQAVHTLSAARNMIMGGRLRYYRQLVDVPVSVSYGLRRRAKASLTNISQGGLGIHLQRSLEMAGAVQVCFQLPGMGRAVKARGEVAWTDRGGNAGIRFVQISRRLQRSVQLWLEKHYFEH